MDHLEDKIIGCLTAGAVGDTLGRPVEGWDYQRIMEKYGVIEDPFADREKATDQLFPDDIGTDDTALAQILCRAYLARDGRVGPEEYAAAWIEQMEVAYYWYCMDSTYELLMNGYSARTTGALNIVTGAGLMSVNPIAIFNAGDPEQAFADALELTSMFQRGLSTLTAAVTAAAMAEAFRPGATVASVLDTAVRMSPAEPFETYNKRNPDNLRDAVTQAAEVGNSYSDYLKLRPEAYEKLTQYQSFDCAETLLLTLAVFATAKGDVRKGVLGGANIGRDSDTISSMVGQMTGALNGYMSMPDTWRSALEKLPGGRNLSTLGREMAGLVRGKFARRIDISQSVCDAADAKTAGKGPENELESRMTGALSASAAGSVCGRLVEHQAWRESADKRLKAADGFPDAAAGLNWGGYGIDFNAQVMTLCKVFLECDGLPTVEDAARIWLQDTDPLAFGDGEVVIKPIANPIRYVMRNVYELLAQGTPPRAAAMMNVPMHTGLYAALPAAMVHACDPEEAYLSARSLASLFQRDRGIVVPALIAAMAADAMRPNASVDSVLDTALYFAAEMPAPMPRVGTPAGPDYLVREAIRCGRNAQSPQQVMQDIGYLVHPYGKRDPYKMLVVVTAAFAYAGTDVTEAVRTAVLECQSPDFAGGCVGFLSAALGGMSVVPSEWTKFLKSLDNGAAIGSTANKMAELAVRKAETAKEAAERFRA